MDHLVVGQRKHEVLREGVEAAEGELVVVLVAKDGIVLQVLQGVVHPTHVPLVPEAEPAGVGGSGHPRPRCRLLGHRLDVRMVAVDPDVELAEELDRFEVLPAPRAVGYPLPGLRE